MSSDLISTINKIINLLRLCEYSEEADWFEERKVLLANPELSFSSREALLREIRSIIAGQGSFSDLSLQAPSSDSSRSMTRMELRQIQWNLANELGSGIDHCLKEMQA